MIYRLRAKVDSRIPLRRPAAFRVQEFTVQLEQAPDGRLGWLGVSARTEPDRFRTELTVEHGKRRGVRMSRDEALYEQMIRLLQELESEMAYRWLGVERVHWDAPFEEREPESDDEQQSLPIRSITRGRQYPDMTTDITSQEVEQLASLYPFPSALVAAKAFFREGMNEFGSFRCVQAFWNFYFVVEGLYGRGPSFGQHVDRLECGPAGHTQPGAGQRRR